MSVFWHAHFKTAFCVLVLCWQLGTGIFNTAAPGYDNAELWLGAWGQWLAAVARNCDHPLRCDMLLYHSWVCRFKLPISSLQQKHKKCLELEFQDLALLWHCASDLNCRNSDLSKTSKFSRCLSSILLLLLASSRQDMSASWETSLKLCNLPVKFDSQPESHLVRLNLIFKFQLKLWDHWHKRTYFDF